MSAGPPDPRRPFRWQDGERVIVFGRGSLESARDLLGEGFALLSTARAVRAVPWLAEAAASVHEVEPGRVDELAGELRARVRGDRLVALGGGRVIDTAKALAAAEPPRRVLAVPTTLSGAEMTSVHRHAAGVPADTPRVRPAVVVNDPAVSATQPVPELAESAANALGHAVEGPLTPLGNPVATLAARAAAQLLRDGLPDGHDADRDALALGALLGGFVIGSTHYGLHHVLSQTLVRFAGLPHGRANALMLPHTSDALRRRAPAQLAELDGALGEPVTELAIRLRDLGLDGGLATLSAGDRELDQCAQEAASRPELALTPPPAPREEIRELYERAR